MAPAAALVGCRAARASALLRRCSHAAASAAQSRCLPAPLQPLQPQQAQWRACRSSSSSSSSNSRRLLCSAAARPAAAAATSSAQPAAAAAAQAGGDDQQQEQQQPHVSVLLQEVLQAFEGRPVRSYVDGTLGAAGHACAMLARHPELSTLVGFDLDPTAHALASARLAAAGAAVVPVAVSPAGSASWEATAAGSGGSSGGSGGGGPTAYVVRSNFGRMATVLQQLPLGGQADGGAGGRGDGGGGGLAGDGVDAILLDLGISSMQVDTADRGFSFLREGPLDMRMDPGARLSAEELVNTWPEAELGRVFREFGEERYWKSIARRIVAAREEQPITTTQQLVRAIGTPGGGGGARQRRGGADAKYKHPATRVFQAIRIAVNGELQSIAQALPGAIECLAPGGRLAVITFHSLEDRIVKWAFRRAAGMAPSDEPLPAYCLPFDEPQAEASVKILTRRPVAPSAQEQAANARSRSAKLRVVERL